MKPKMPEIARDTAFKVLTGPLRNVFLKGDGDGERTRGNVGGDVGGSMIRYLSTDPLFLEELLTTENSSTLSAPLFKIATVGERREQ